MCDIQQSGFLGTNWLLWNETMVEGIEMQYASEKSRIAIAICKSGVWKHGLRQNVRRFLSGNAKREKVNGALKVGLQTLLRLIVWFVTQICYQIWVKSTLRCVALDEDGNRTFGLPSTYWEHTCFNARLDFRQSSSRTRLEAVAIFRRPPDGLEEALADPSPLSPPPP